MGEKKAAVISLKEDGFIGQIEGKDYQLNLTSTSFNATDIMLMSVAYCFGITVDAYAKHKGLDLRNLRIRAIGKKHDTENRYESIKLQVHFDGDLKPEQIERVLTIGKRGCTVSNSMLKPISFDVEYSDGE